MDFLAYSEGVARRTGAYALMLGLYYMGNPSLFTQLEIESTTNLFAKPNEQNDACIKSAMARKGGCEETNFIQSLINPKGDQPDDAE